MLKVQIPLSPPKFDFNRSTSPKNNLASKTISSLQYKKEGIGGCMNPTVFFKSFLAGIGICLPLGPINLIIIRKTVHHDKNSALFPGLGSAVADLFYGTIVGFGLAPLSDFFSHYQKYVQLGAAVILLVVSFKILRTDPKKLLAHETITTKTTHLKNFFLGFSLAIFNPSTLFFMTTILTMLGTANNIHHTYTGVLIILGLFLGELTWWFLLTRLTDWAQKKIGAHAPVTINKFTGIILFTISVAIIIKSVFF